MINSFSETTVKEAVNYIAYILSIAWIIDFILNIGRINSLIVSLCLSYVGYMRWKSKKQHNNQ